MEPTLLTKKPRPDQLEGQTYRIETEAGRLFCTVNSLDGSPFEVFLRVAKHGGDLHPYTESIGRLISLCLRYGVPVEEVIRQTEGVGGFRDPVSVPDAAALTLRAVQDGTTPQESMKKRREGGE